MKMFKIIAAALLFAGFSVNAHAFPATGTLSVTDGVLGYNAAGITGDAVFDDLLASGGVGGTIDFWTYAGSFNFSATVVGIPPAFDQNVDWYVSAFGEYHDLTVNQIAMPSPFDRDDFEVIDEYLGHGSVQDLFSVDLPTLLGTLGAISGTPTLASVIGTVNSILDGMIVLGPELSSIASNIWVALDGNTVSFVSTEGLTIDGVGNVDSASVAYSGSLSITAVPEPSALGLLGFGLIGVAFIRRRKMAA